MVQYKVGFPFGCDLSEAHLFFWSGGNINWGSYPENDTNFLRNYGIPDEACWPYPKDKYQYPLNTTCPDWQNRTVKIKNWSYLSEDPIAIKTALVTNGPVPTYFMVYKDFQQYEKGIYQHKWGRFIAPHYITIIGYDDQQGCWLCKNSWGKNWGDNGWFKVKYGECGIEKKSFFLHDVYGKFPIVYVDDNNTNGPWNGSKEYPYQYIQDGIDNAYDGYGIFVYNGTYNENVVINKTIELIGASFIADEPSIFGTPNDDYIKKEIAWYEKQSTNIYDIRDRDQAPPAAWKYSADKHGNINSNYGHLIWSDKYFNQYGQVLDELLLNPDGRRATMIYNRPSIWMEYSENGKSDFICTNAVTYYIHDGLLHFVVQMR